jgi:hypothetical protein
MPSRSLDGRADIASNRKFLATNSRVITAHNKVAGQLVRTSAATETRAGRYAAGIY